MLLLWFSSPGFNEGTVRRRKGTWYVNSQSLLGNI